MKSSWIYHILISHFLCQVVAAYLFQPPRATAHYVIASKPKHAGQFIQLVRPLENASPMPQLGPAFKSLTIPFPKVSTELPLVTHTPNPVAAFAETPPKKLKAKKKSGKDDMKNFIEEMNSEKEHEKKLADILPLVTFDCHDISEGYYADVAFRCEVFHYCGKPSGKRFTFFCPPGSRFNQMHMTCDYEMFQGCDKSHEYFHLNDKMYQRDDDNTTKPPHHQSNTTPIPSSHFTYKSVSTTQRQITTVKSEPKLKQVKETSFNRPERSRYTQRQWPMVYPQRPMVMKAPPRLGRLQSAASHMPTSRVLLNPHYIPRIRGKKTSIAVPVPRREIPLRSHLMSNRRHSHLQYFPPAHEFRRRPLPPPDLAYDYYDQPLEPMPVSARRKTLGHNAKTDSNWKSVEEDWKRNEKTEVKKPVEASRRSSQATRKVPTKDKWDELDKAVEHWKLAGSKRREQNAVKVASETEESESESSEEEVTTTKASRRKLPKAKPRSTTSFSVVSTTAKTTTTRRPVKQRVKTSSIGGRINNRRSTTTMSSSRTRPTAVSTSTVASSGITTLPFDLDAYTEAQTQATEVVTQVVPKHKHRFTKVQRTRMKTSTSPTPYSPTVSFAITIKPVTFAMSTAEALIEDRPVAAAYVNTEDRPAAAAYVNTEDTG